MTIVHIVSHVEFEKGVRNESSPIHCFVLGFIERYSRMGTDKLSPLSVLLKWMGSSLRSRSRRRMWETCSWGSFRNVLNRAGIVPVTTRSLCPQMQRHFLRSSMISAAPAELTVLIPEEADRVQVRAIRDIREPHLAMLPDGLACRLV